MEGGATAWHRRRMHVRRAAPGDAEEIAFLRSRLWPDGSIEDHRREVQDAVAGRPLSTLPLVTFVAEDNRRLIGFVEVGLRSHADGCDPTRPCGFVEGWYVVPDQRRRGIGRALIERAEVWAREQRCTEIASDTWIDNPESQRAHAALGFEVVDRCVHFRKELVRASDNAGEVQPHLYGADLARIHHDHFGTLARAAARELTARLSRRGLSSGTVVDLAAGSGILSRALSERGFAVRGVDISDDMLRIARAEAPAAEFVQGSLWSVGLPPHITAVAAVGEAFSYSADPIASLSALEDRLAAIHRALVSGGLVLFDVAGPGRSGPTGSRHAFWHHEDTYLGMLECEIEGAAKLTRTITLFAPEGGLYRRVEETHELRLYAPEEVEALLTRIGFSWERLERYDDFELKPGWHAYAAAKRMG
jgi:aminoglycoside 6'-N-acetyltransferase I